MNYPNLRPEFKVFKESAGSGQFLVAANPDGFKRTLARCYTEETADILVAALIAAKDQLLAPVAVEPVLEPIMRLVPKSEDPLRAGRTKAPFRGKASPKVLSDPGDTISERHLVKKAKAARKNSHTKPRNSWKGKK